MPHPGRDGRPPPAGRTLRGDCLVATNDDAIPQTASCSVTVTILEVRSIGEIQGSVGDTANGLTHRSPLAPATGNSLGQTVATRGVIVQKTLARTAAGVRNYGLFLQEPAAATDSDPTTSDGILVFMNTFSTLIGGYAPQVGDEVVVTGRVSEFFNLTQLSSASLVQLVREDVDLDAEVPAFEVDPPADLAAANRYWERHEGMQARVPTGSLVQGGRSVFASTADAEIYFYRDDYGPLADRSDPSARRIFRDPHPLDDVPDQLFDNGNGLRFLIGALGGGPRVSRPPRRRREPRPVGRGSSAGCRGAVRGPLASTRAGRVGSQRVGGSAPRRHRPVGPGDHICPGCLPPGPHE